MNEEKVTGTFDEAKGKVKQSVGEATGDQSLANEGVADQVKGQVKQTWGNIKDAAHNLGHSERAEEEKASAEQHGDHLRESISHAAENVKDSIKRGLDHLQHKAND